MISKLPQFKCVRKLPKITGMLVSQASLGDKSHGSRVAKNIMCICTDLECIVVNIRSFSI